ncbi:MAG: O-acetylhomoserine aminocarboxypropyltransferase/cysteine synthase [Planctomycetia bacterium]|nr:O-acetylhomoserine aminocarboxypropyltransferase/cysteine synthase [Planctomycetia bacterium]
MSEEFNKKYGLGTLAIHAGQVADPVTGSRALPIHQTTCYTFKNAEYAAEIFALNIPGWIYTRLQNPTNDAFEQRMAALDGGIGAVATASGMQAILVSLLNLARCGEHIVSAAALYGGTVTLLTQTFPKFGIQSTLVNATDLAQIEQAIRPNTRAIYLESLANPKNDVLEYDKIADLAHQYDIPVVIDNTVLTPALFKPFDYGCDISVSSCTKYICGHGTSMGGVIVDSGNFDWSKNPDKWYQFMKPDQSYHGLVFHEKFGQNCYLAACRTNWMRDLGGCISPFNSFLMLQGLETLHLRMPVHSQNAQKLAEFLERHPKVSTVNYPGLPSHQFHNLAAKYFPNGCSGVLGFNIVGGREAGQKFIENVKLASHVANLGDAKTLVVHPASTTHSQLTDEELIQAGIGPDFVRVSVGIEDINDIIADMDQALNA